MNRKLISATAARSATAAAARSPARSASRTVSRTAILGAILLAATPAFAADPTAAELLARIDANEGYSSITYSGEMVIEYQGKRYVKKFEAAARGGADSFIEFTNSEDRGTKYLKKDGRLYVYSPDTEEVMLISGHLLKESMMGSDLSYEDTIENEKLSARYTPTLAGRTELDGKAAWILELAAKKKTESYPKQTLWIDAQTGDLLRSEQYALSGAKLKEYVLLKAETIGSRRFPVEMQMRDLLRKGSRTTFHMTDVVLDASVPDSVFSQRNLKK
ncbi:MAG TPA: outer membrane lipoprotein-sorting protein [Treponema sp.]|nr:outer membrane lipoprotein-sorting protein [Treponema sp.]